MGVDGKEVETLWELNTQNGRRTPLCPFRGVNLLMPKTKGVKLHAYVYKGVRNKGVKGKRA